MRFLADSNVLLRLPQRNDPQHLVIRRAFRTVLARGDEICYTSQILGEFWSVCSRPSGARGGFGLPVAETDRRVRLIERRFTLLADSLAVHREWRRLLTQHSISGVQVHDTRLAAAMRVHGLTDLITLNGADFARFRWITVHHPSSL